MHYQLLTTKLYLPRRHPNLVPRPRLTERLNDGITGKLVLVCAPPGFGKTTLLGEWRASEPWSRRPVAWLSLDEGDNDPHRFWTYFATAIEQLHHGAGDSTLTLLQTLPPPSTEAIVTSLVNAVASIAEDFALVLDDYHVVVAASIHTGLTFLLSHLPPQMHLAITSRADPPLPMARLRARGKLLELRDADLCFTPDEVATFLNQVMGLGLSSDDVAALEARTEGWIAGLQLAALSMQKEQNLTGFVKSFAGSHRHVLDYLVDEVLLRQPESMQSFLLHTSILERLSGPLCDAVTERGDGQMMLEMLERANLFTVPLDSERSWYRYHHLFAESLRSRLVQMHPDRLVKLHRRASEWCERNGFAVPAIEHALAAGGPKHAMRLVEKAAQTMLMHSEVNTLLGWLEALPGKLVRSRPRLCLARAWGLIAASRLDDVEPCLEHALEALPATSQKEGGDDSEAKCVLGEIAALRATVAGFRQDVPRTMELSRQALRDLPQSNLFARAHVAINLGVAYRFQGDEDSAIKGFAEAATLSQAAGNLLVGIVAISSLAQVYARQGHLRRAAHLYRRALRLADEHSARSLVRCSCPVCRQLSDGRGTRPFPLAGLAHVGLARLLYQWNDLDGALQHLTTGIELGKQWSSVEILHDGYTIMARVLQAQGDAQPALDAIHEAEHLIEEHNLTYRVAQVAAARARLAVAQGDLAAAAHCAQRCLKSTDEQSCYLTELAHITLARVLIAQSRADEAIRLLEPQRAAAEEAGRTGSVIEILGLLATAMESQHHTALALATLAQALALGQPEGYVRVFIDEGPAMATLLAKVAAAQQKGGPATPDVSVAYLHRLLAAFGAPHACQGTPPPQDLPQPLAEPLSKRELEVLRMVAAGSSNGEIADSLVVAICTVKSHTNSIFAKLNVRNRTGAVARARELDLV